MASDYSTPIESRKIFEKEILENPLLPNLPKEINEVSKLVRFEGNEKPSIPVNWRFAESISALKAFEASLLIVLLIRKYETEPVKVNINTSVNGTRCSFRAYILFTKLYTVIMPLFSSCHPC